jgi:hypothetical protein
MRKHIAMLSMLAVLSGFAAVGCAKNPAPAGTPEAKVFNADQLMKDISALQGVADALHTAQGQLHISDHDLVVVNDFAAVANAALLAYQNGSNTLGVVITTYHAFVANLSGDIYLNDSFKFVLKLVDAGIGLIPGYVSTTVIAAK